MGKQKQQSQLELEEVPALALEMEEDQEWGQAQDQALVEVWEAWEQGVLVYLWAEDQCLQQDQDQDQCPLQDQDQTLQQGQDPALDHSLLLDQDPLPFHHLALRDDVFHLLNIFVLRSDLTLGPGVVFHQQPATMVTRRAVENHLQSM